ncbi:unnamed protein product [Trifolium pratense]|uniref:Uncharacterized protein n=1 Tax=Trifolium pratense TaxID=57577 RepID=A0ACB0JUK8_TRIPR|nr:unnamed protein product [Trifolium pratense]
MVFEDKHVNRCFCRSTHSRIQVVIQSIWDGSDLISYVENNGLHAASKSSSKTKITRSSRQLCSTWNTFALRVDLMYQFLQELLFKAIK